VYWPAFLMAADLPLPKQIVAHGWWTIEGEKMSKSLGNVLSPQQMIEEAGSIDHLRYFMLRAMPFGNDGDFSRERMVETINADLANNIGNLAQRTLSMIQKNCEGTVPEYGELLNVGNYDDNEMLFMGKRALKSFRKILFKEGLDFSEVIKYLLALAREANEYIDERAPWMLKKENPERMKTVLYVLAETARHIAILLQPFCPLAAGKLLDQLAVPEDERSFAHLTAEYALKPGTPLPKPEGVFPRLEG
ncbi:MAG: methionine--tRNA ligase, partial [Rickettsiales bacterium]|nr:methionine--tRNA ligase [Rickettsiales bacterium]